MPTVSRSEWGARPAALAVPLNPPEVVGIAIHWPAMREPIRGRESVDAAILFADDRTALADSFDDVLPRLGSIPLVWISYPIRDADIDEDAIQELTADYGWYAVESIILDETWAALRVEQT